MTQNRDDDKKPRRIPVNDLEAEEHRERELPVAPVNREDEFEGNGDALLLNGDDPATDAEHEGDDTPVIDVEGPGVEAADSENPLAQMEDRWKRAAADLDNYRKRFKREMTRLRKIDRKAVLHAWLEVMDSMERALCVDGASSNPWYEGMEAIHQQMIDVLGRFGAKPFVPMGEQFNPELHEAVATADLPDQPQGTIVEVVQTGYILDGKALRPAKVIAVKHGE